MNKTNVDHIGANFALQADPHQDLAREGRGDEDDAKTVDHSHAPRQNVPPALRVDGVHQKAHESTFGKTFRGKKTSQRHKRAKSQTKTNKNKQEQIWTSNKKYSHARQLKDESKQPKVTKIMQRGLEVL